MIKVSIAIINRMEKMFPGIIATIQWYEALELPPCVFCRSPDTASAQAGVIGRTIHLQAATTKFRLTTGGFSQGIYVCNACGRQFGPTERHPREENLARS